MTNGSLLFILSAQLSSIICILVVYQFLLDVIYSVCKILFSNFSKAVKYNVKVMLSYHIIKINALLIVCVLTIRQC